MAAPPNAEPGPGGPKPPLSTPTGAKIGELPGPIRPDKTKPPEKPKEPMVPKKQLDEALEKLARMENQFNVLKTQTQRKEEAVGRKPEISAEYGEPVPFNTLAQRALDNTMARFTRKRMEVGPQAVLGMSQEQRPPGWFKKTFLKIPFLGFLAPSGMDRLPASAINIATVGQAATASKDVLLTTLNPALTVGALGALTRGAVDGIRWAVMKEKTAGILARELARRGTDGRKSLDQTAAWKIVFGDKPDISQLINLSKELKPGMHVEQLMLDKREMRRLIKKAFGVKLDALVLERILPGEVRERLNEQERLELQDIETAYETASQLYQEGLSAAERAEFVQNELPFYLDQREITNHLKAMAVRSGIAGFKTSLVGAAVSLFKGLEKVHLLRDWGNSISGTVSQGVTSLQSLAKKWLSGASQGLKALFDKIPLPNLNPVTASAGATAGAGAATLSMPVKTGPFGGKH